MNKIVSTPRLSKAAVKAEYKTYSGQEVLLAGKPVRVILEQVDTKSGSWERGFKFGSITYGILRWARLRGAEYSANHGVTWHESLALAKKSKDKVIVERSTPHGEFAFDSIQRINREYDPVYKWRA